MAKLVATKNAEQIRAMLTEGNETEIFEYLARIEYHPKQVLLFKQIYDEYVDTSSVGDWEGTYPERDEIEASVLESFDHLAVFIADMPKERNLGLYVVFFNHGGGEVTVEMGWIDGGAGQGPLLWDRWQGRVSSPILAFTDISCEFDICDYQCVQKPKGHIDVPMYRYHPERFKAYRVYAESLGQIYRSRADPKSGLIGLETLQKITNLVILEANEKGAKFPRRDKEHISSVFVFDVEPSLAMAYGRFVQAGRQIIDFPPALTEMLANTDVENIPMKAVKLPFAAQYIYFGPQENLEMEPGWLVDGAYVESRGEEGDIRFTVTTVPTDHSLSSLWYIYPETHYSQDFIETYREADLSHAIDGVLKENIKELKTRQLKSGGDITEMIRTQALLEEKPLNIPEGLTVIDSSPTNAGIRMEKALRQHPLYRAALRLVVNGLCYITAYPDDITLAWPSGTPRGLREKTESPDSKIATRAKSKLASMGYTPIHICGKRIIEQREAAGVSISQHHVSSHWRRGHWRNQAHGARFSLRKLIWVMPTLIAADRAVAEIPGHLYLA